MEYRVCYEDTDAGGIVYYGNYLRYFERGRTELLRESGLSVKELADGGHLFPVVHVDVDYRSPSFYDDLIRIETEVVEIGRTSVTFGHQIFRSEDLTLLVEGKVVLVCAGTNLKPRRIPRRILEIFGDTESVEV